ncbi:iron chelate uptake ABC transporter family permease subunit [Virgibacillus halodenitrificans]|uniref:FecCD family ABC transporter permease n=1 Tax=Virgibacillus halodenitrificans TaxID=1482 RepID=UPI001371D546|nr:iron ABC transporter permease [Virgibacillus halodenitrificans]MYL45206.1 iron chelate uptake ABC transporter family permease subunit [Virgibacillus halodenitrificans]
MKKNVSFRLGKLSFLINKRSFITIVGLTLLIILLMIVSLGIGQMKISPIHVVKAIFSASTDMENLVVQSFRMPRILLSILAGAALAMSGAILQGIIRNPLASPDIIGITGGASFTTVAFLALYSDRSNTLTLSIHWLPLASFIGAVVIGFLVYFLAWKNGGIAPIRLVLIGVGVSAAVQALTTMMMLLGPIFTASRANIWITGSVNGTNWTEVATLAPWILFLTFILFVYSRRLNMHDLGEELVTNAGGFVQKDRFILLLLSTALAGGAVAFAGGVGFVGLMAPHMARRLVGSSYGVLLPVSALLGGTIVLVADLIARTAFAPLEVPVGVFTSAIGAPYFIYLLFKSRNK